MRTSIRQPIPPSETEDAVGFCSVTNKSSNNSIGKASLMTCIYLDRYATSGQTDMPDLSYRLEFISIPCCPELLRVHALICMCLLGATAPTNTNHNDRGTNPNVFMISSLLIVFIIHVLVSWCLPHSCSS